MNIVTTDETEKILVCSLYSFLISSSCKDLNLSKLNAIEVRNLDKQIGGKYLKGVLFVDKAALNSVIENNKPLDHQIIYHLLECDESFRVLVNSIYHELHHCDAEYHMPNLHQYSYKDLVVENEEVLWRKIVVHYWIECFVSYRSNINPYVRKDKLMSQIKAINWNVTSIAGEKYKYDNMIGLSYCSSYFISQYLAYGYNYRYLNDIHDLEIKELYHCLIKETKNLLDTNKYIDDYSQLLGLEKIFKDYFAGIISFK